MYPGETVATKYGLPANSFHFKEEILQEYNEESLIPLNENLEDVEKLVGECSALLRAIKESDPSKDSPLSILDNLSKVEIGLDLIRQRLLSCANRNLTAQEFEELDLDHLKQGDPSVEFFGLEWTSVFSKCYSLGFELRLLKAGLEQNRLCTYRLRVCFSLINQLLAEAHMHTMAVDSGRLRSNHLNLQALKQQTSSGVGRTGSFKQLEKPGLKRQPAKYQGSRTDSALATSAHRQDQPKPKPVGQKRRKSSFMDSFSNIFKAGFS